MLFGWYKTEIWLVLVFWSNISCLGWVSSKFGLLIWGFCSYFVLAWAGLPVLSVSI